MRPRRSAGVVVLAMLLGTLAVGTRPASALVDDTTPSNGWRPNGGTAYALARAGDMIIIGGSFTSMISATGSTAPRNRLAAVSASTGALLAWAPALNGEVRALAVSSDSRTVYVGGTFTGVGGVPRSNLAAVSAISGQATPFTADTNATVRALLLHENSLLVGGIFWRVRDAARGGGAELDPLTGALKPWNPRTNYGTYTIEPAVDGSGFFVGGPFTTVGGQPRSHVAKVATGSGDLLPWLSGSTCQDALNPCVVYAMRADGTDLFLAMGGPGGRVSGLVASTGHQRWWTGGDGDVQTITVDGARVYGGGHFAATMNGASRAGLVALDRHTGAVLNELDAHVVGGTGVWSVLKDGNRLRFAGQHSSIDGAAIGRYSSFPVLPDQPDATAPATPSNLRSPAPLADGVTLSWAPSADDVATVGYRVSRDGSVLGTTPIPQFKDLGVTAGATYLYGVSALDAAGNASATRTVPVTTEAAAPSLVRRAAAWAHHSRGTLPAPDWYATNYDDSNWSRGRGEFGFGEGDEQTYISPLGVTHYFRTTFDVATGTTLQSARLRAVVDDGAVVYLNGTEVGRHNMPGGAIDQNTLASTAVGGDAEMTYQSMSIPSSAVRTGRNVLAIEVHNSSSSSSDISFDAFLPYIGATTPSQPAAPSGLRGNAGPTSVSLSWDASAGADSYVVTRDGVVVGTPAATAFTDDDVETGKTYTYRVAGANSAGPGTSSPPLLLTTTAAPDSYAASGDTWRYLDDGADLGGAWRQPGYGDASWRVGPTQAGYGDGDERTTLGWGDDAGRKPLTVYARRTFDAGSSTSEITSLTMRLLVDDGAVVYLNGVELTRFNLPTGGVTSTTRATRALSGDDELVWRSYDLPTTALAAGTNTLAAEIHNDSSSSSDLSFDLELRPNR